MWSKRLLGAGLVAATALSAAGCSGKGDKSYEVSYHLSGSGTGVAMRDIGIEYVNGDGQRAKDTTSSVSPDWSINVTLPSGSSVIYVLAQTVGDDPHYTLTCTITVNGVEAVKKTGWYTCEANVDLAKL